MANSEKGILASITLRDNVTRTMDRIIRTTDDLVNKFNDVGKVTEVGGSSMDNMFMRGVTGAVALAAAVYSVVVGFGALAAVTDMYANNMARLNLVTNSMEAAKQAQDDIFYSVLNTGAAYGEMVGTVAKLGTLASHAFTDIKEITKFSELMAKQFVIGGSGTREQAMAMYQLTQAMASGRLQGDEFRSIIENAPLLAQAIAKSTGVSIAGLREMSKNGEITSTVIKEAVYKAADEIEERFNKMPITFERAMNMMGTIAYRAMVPVWQALGSISNNKGFQDLLLKVYPVLNFISLVIAGTIYNAIALFRALTPVAVFVFDTIYEVASNAFYGLVDIFNFAFPIFMFLLGAYAIAWTVINIQLIANIAVTALQTAWMFTQAAAIAVITTAKVIWTAVTRGLILGQIMLGIVLALLTSPISGTVALIVILIAIFAAWWAKSEGLREVIAKCFEYIVDITQWLVNSSIGLINKLIETYNKAGNVLGKIFGFEFKETATIKYKADFEGFKKEYSNLIKNGSMDDWKGALGLNGFGGLPGASGGFDPSTYMPEDSQANKDTAKNTKDIKEKMEITEDYLESMMDLAEKEYNNNFKIFDIKMEVSSNTVVNNKGDMDGYVDELAEGLFSAIKSGVEGEYA